MSDHTFVYAIPIATTPEKLWEALTQNEFWQQYWEGEWRIESDWKVGSPLRFYTSEGKLYSQGEILACDPPRTLTYTWPPTEKEKDTVQAEHLTWEITPTGPGIVTLKLIHERLSRENYQGVSQGWPKILGRMKMVLER